MDLHKTAIEEVWRSMTIQILGWLLERDLISKETLPFVTNFLMGIITKWELRSHIYSSRVS